jgi:hypothetical protein
MLERLSKSKLLFARLIVASAMLAEVPHGTYPALMLRNVASRSAFTVVVVDPILYRLFELVD